MGRGQYGVVAPRHDTTQPRCTAPHYTAPHTPLTTHYTTRPTPTPHHPHYTTPLHYTNDLHYTTPQHTTYTTLHQKWEQDLPVRYTTPHNTALHNKGGSSQAEYATLHYTTLHNTTRHTAPYHTRLHTPHHTMPHCIIVSFLRGSELIRILLSVTGGWMHIAITLFPFPCTRTFGVFASLHNKHFGLG